MSGQSVTVIGAGLAGAACARALRDGGVEVRVVDRGRAPGGRMASPEIGGRRVDIGAGYFTVRDSGFTAVVDGWREGGLAREWTDTFGSLAPDAEPDTTSGPVRWATPDGLRSLVREVLDGIVVDSVDLDALPPGDVVVAMPDPQAARLVHVPDAVDYDPVIAVACEFDSHAVSFADLPFTDAAFVNDHPDVTFIADDGARRGDHAPVLVVHTTSSRAAAHLADPDSVVPVVVAAVTDLLGIAPPVSTHAHRWTFAKPAGAHDAGHHLSERDGRLVGLAGDQWCPKGSPRVESAWRSGTDLAAAIIAAR